MSHCGSPSAAVADATSKRQEAKIERRMARYPLVVVTTGTPQRTGFPYSSIVTTPPSSERSVILRQFFVMAEALRAVWEHQVVLQDGREREPIVYGWV